MPVNESLVHLIDKAQEQLPVKEIIKMSPEVLQGITAERAEFLQKAIGVKTIEDLATNKFILWAQALTTIASQEK